MPVTENCIFESHKLSNEDYHDDLALGSSGFKLFMNNPGLYYAFYRDPRGKKHRTKTKQNLFGSTAHIALLEPEKFEKDFVVLQEKETEDGKEINKTHKAYKDFAKQALLEGKEALLHHEYESFCEMSAHIMSDDLARACLTGVGINECSFFIKDKNLGIMRKSRPDRIVDLRGLNNYRYVIADYKTTELYLDESTQNRYIWPSSRDIQGAYHKDVVEQNREIKIDAVIYITQMSKYPYFVQCYEMPKEDLDDANEKIQMHLQGYTDYKGIYHKGFAECEKDGIWPKYPGGIIPYTRPAWKNYEYN